MLKELKDAIWNLQLTTYFVLYCTLITIEILYLQCQGELYLQSGDFGYNNVYLFFLS